MLLEELRTHAIRPLTRLGRLLVALLLLAAAAPPAGLVGAAPAARPASAPPLPSSVYSSVATWGGPAASALAKGLAVDGSGNTYVVGEFFGTVDFDPSGPNPAATVASHTDTVDAYLTKFDSAGVFQWVRAWGGAPSGAPRGGPGGYDGRDAANGVALDAAGNIYVAGLYQNTVDFGAGYVYTSHAPSGSNNIFVAKFAPTGATQWARAWGGTTGGEAYSVAVDPARGWVYVEGDWSSDLHVNGGQVDFNPAGPASDLHPNHGAYDAFLSQYDLGGAFHWARTWGGSGYDDGPGVAVDSAGRVYVGGMYGSADINFDPAGGSAGLGHGTAVNSYTAVNVFLSQFDAAGAFHWVRTWGGQNTEDAANAVAVDRADRVYIGGRFECACNFNAGPTGPPANFSSHGDRDAFLSQYDASGNFHWARTWGGSGWDAVGGLAVDAANNILTAGIFTDTVDFNPDGGDLHASHGGRDAFINQFDSAGTFQWAQTWGGPGSDLGLGLALDAAGRLAVAGAFQNNVNFNPAGGPDNRAALGLTDAYLSRLSPALVLTAAPGDQTLHLGWTLSATLPATATWTLRYLGGPGQPASPLTGLPAATRAAALTGLTNGVWYTLTLTALVSAAPVLTATVLARPSRIYYLDLPLVCR